MAAAERAPRGAAQDELLHEVRKDAKASRYAAEAVRGVFGKPAARYAAAVAELQESLGDFQDGVVTRAVLRELGAQGSRAGQNGFTFGRLHALEQVKAEAAVAAFPQARQRCPAAGSGAGSSRSAGTVVDAPRTGRDAGHRPVQRRAVRRPCPTS
jgi:CHAD domain-containing protein